MITERQRLARVENGKKVGVLPKGPTTSNQIEARRRNISKAWGYNRIDTPLCKYCDKPAKKNIRPDGRHKGYCATCGSSECLKEAYNNPSVKEKKRLSLANRIKLCKICMDPIKLNSNGQVYCRKCVPSKFYANIFVLYGISKVEYENLYNKYNGLCWVCRENKGEVIDHSHETEEVRGILCYRCNTSLSIVENNDLLIKAHEYLDSFKIS